MMFSVSDAPVHLRVLDLVSVLERPELDDDVVFSVERTVALEGIAIRQATGPVPFLAPI